MQEARQLGLGLLVLCIGLAAEGCGRSTGEVTGKVLFRNKPLAAGSAVTFFPASGKGASTGRVTADGSYTVFEVPLGKVRIAIAPHAAGIAKLDPKMKMMRDALKSGKMKVAPEELEKMPPQMREAVEAVKGGASSDPSVTIPKEYTDPSKSGLEYTVTAGKQTYDIELK